MNYLSDLKKVLNSWPSASNFKSFSRSLEQFFLTVGQNNFGNKIPFFMVTSDPESSLGGGALVNNDNSSFCCLQVEDRSLTLASRS